MKGTEVIGLEAQDFKRTEQLETGSYLEVWQDTKM